MPSGNARKRTKEETRALMEASRKRSEGAKKRTFDYPFEDRGGSPLEDMLSPEQRGHRWRNAAHVKESLKATPGVIDYFESVTEAPRLSDSDRLSLAVTYYGISHDTENALMELTQSYRFGAESLRLLDSELGPESDIRREVFGMMPTGKLRSHADLSMIEKAFASHLLNEGRFSEETMRFARDRRFCAFDVKGVEEALRRVRALDEDDPVRLEVEGICARDYPEHDVVDADGNVLPGFETIEWQRPEPVVSDCHVCEAPRGMFWGDDGVELARKVWAKDFQTNRSIVGLVKEGPYGHDYKVFIPTAYSINTHTMTNSALKGTLVAEGRCKSAQEAMCRASYYIEKCAIIPLSDAKKHGFATDEAITNRTWEVVAVSRLDSSYIDTYRAQKKAAFRALPEEERKRRTEYAKSMAAKKGAAPKRTSVRDEVSSRISGGRRAKSLDERGACAEKRSSEENRAQVASRTRQNTEKSGGGHR
jgi:hypothetical protein